MEMADAGRDTTVYSNINETKSGLPEDYLQITARANLKVKELPDHTKIPEYPAIADGDNVISNRNQELLPVLYVS